jgi:uncharacterized protein YceK
MILFTLLDVPFSAVADTLLLPVTLALRDERSGAE